MTTHEKQGWWLVAGLAALTGTIYGLTLAALGVLAPTLAASLGCSSAQVSQTTTAFMLAMTLTLPLAGWLLDRYSARRVMGAGLLLILIGYGFAARSTSVLQLGAALALTGAGVGASTYVPASALIAQWIEQRRGLAFAILMCGSSIGTALLPLLISEAVERLGWRASLLWSAAVIAGIAVPVLLYLVRTPPEASTVPAHRGRDADNDTLLMALRQPPYWWFTLQQALALLSCMGVYFFIVPYFTASGFSTQTSVLLYGATSIAGLVGFLGFGLLADRRGALPVMVLGLTLCACGMAPLFVTAIGANGPGAALLFAAVWGATSSLPSQLAPLLLIDLQGARHFGSLMGINSFVSGLAGSVAPVLIAQLHQMTGAYTSGFALCVAALLLAALIAIPMRRRHSAMPAPGIQ